jgi:endoglucanase
MPRASSPNDVTSLGSVAKTFKGNDAVIFDLFNEPDPEGVLGSGEDAAWECWLKGGSSCAGFPYPVAGMQTLVNTVRATGAHNVIMAGGLDTVANFS